MEASQIEVTHMPGDTDSADSTATRIKNKDPIGDFNKDLVRFYQVGQSLITVDLWAK